jgi:hypothetical protein
MTLNLAIPFFEPTKCEYGFLLIADRKVQVTYNYGDNPSVVRYVDENKYLFRSNLAAIVIGSLIITSEHEKMSIPSIETVLIKKILGTIGAFDHYESYQAALVAERDAGIVKLTYIGKTEKRTLLSTLDENLAEDFAIYMPSEKGLDKIACGEIKYPNQSKAEAIGIFLYNTLNTREHKGEPKRYKGLDILSVSNKCIRLNGEFMSN